MGQYLTSNVTRRHRGPNQKLLAGYRASSLQRTSYLCELLFYKAGSIFHRRVWYHALSLRMCMLCAYMTFGHHPHPKAIVVPNFISVISSVAEVARRE